LAESLAQATLALNTSLELDVVLDQVLEQIQEVIPCTAAAVLLLDGKKALLARLRGVETISTGIRRLEKGVPLHRLPQMEQACRQKQGLIANEEQLRLQWDYLLGLDWIQSMMIAPLDAGDQVLGTLTLVSHEPGYFQSEDLSHLQAFTSHAVLAIKNARLFKSVETGLEHQQALSHRLVEVQESERSWVARELHDEAGQALTSIKVGLRLLERRATEPEAVREGLEAMKRIVDSVMETLHNLAMDLHPTSLDYLGLVTALQQHSETFQKTYGIKVQFENLGFTSRLPAEMETALYRIVQEALTNVARHAQASQVDILLQQHNDKIVLIVEDNGIGFDPASVKMDTHLGVFGMHERVDMLRGRLTIESHSGKGTLVQVEVPYGN